METVIVPAGLEQNTVSIWIGLFRNGVKNYPV